MAPHDAFASFETKWTAAHPEFGLALGFVAAAQRTPRSALACIGYEIGHAAFRIAEAQVAAGKLQWWFDEFTALGAGQPRHPLTQALAASATAARVPAQVWQAVIAGALAQRESEPPPTLDALLDGYQVLYRPLAQAGQMLFGDADNAEVATARALSRAFRDALALPALLERGHLVLPLDLLARHRLSRSDLAAATAQRSGALRDHFASLAARMAAIEPDTMPTLEAVGLHVEKWRCRRAALSRDKLAAGDRLLARLPLSASWAAWRAARRRVHP